MNSRSGEIAVNDLVLVQPMRYCYTFAEGSLENLLVEDKHAPNYTTIHHTADGFKARVLQIVNLEKPLDGEMITEEYVEVKIFGQGRKHFVKRNGEKTKVIWIQKRLVSKCRE
tara:strand:+ start:1169 stop:1507 length:339 start_codon:yes stop_codon:yes gene_type:complete